MSEFGFQSFPEMKTIATFAAPGDYQIESEVMNAHQKSSIGNALIRTYMERDYIVPEKFEDFVYVGLVLQGQGMRHGLEAHRRNRPYCMGTLYWQLNDSWPVVSGRVSTIMVTESFALSCETCFCSYSNQPYSAE